MSGYTKGMPVWFQIPAISISRAQGFYTTLFNFQFRAPQSAGDGEESISHFTYPHPILGEQLMIGGGVMKVKDGEKIVDNLHKPGTGSVGPLMYFFVDDIEEAMEKAKEMGGMVLLGRTAEGKHGEYAVLQDTECVYTNLRYRLVFQSSLLQEISTLDILRRRLFSAHSIPRSTC